MKSLRSLLILTPLLVALGCADQTPTPDRVRPPQVRVEGALGSDIVFSPIMTSYNGGSLHVEVPLRSTTDLDIKIGYRLTWLDDSGNPVGSPSGSETKLLHSNKVETISGDSPTSQARDFTIDIESVGQMAK